MKATIEQQIINQIQRAKKILCVTQSPVRADGMASVLASHIFLSKLGKEVVSVIPEGVHRKLQFLPNQEKIETKLGEKGDFVISVSTKNAKVERVKYVIEDDYVDILVTPKSKSFSDNDVSFKHNLANFDIILVLDSPDLNSLGDVFEDHTHLFSEKTVINISTCPENDFFGKINWVDTSKSSTSEMLFHLFEQEKEFYKTLDEDIATTLLTGIIASTGSFLEPNTVASGFESAGKLQELGARQSDIIEHCFKQKSFPTLRIWGTVLEYLEFDPIHKIAWSRLDSQSNFKSDDIENISDELLRFVEDAQVSALFIEEPNQIRVELRSSLPNFQWKKLTNNFDFETKEYGIDLIILNEDFVDIEHDILHQIVTLQKERIGIDADVEMGKLDINKASKILDEEISQSKNSKKTKKKVIPKIPVEIPFEASFQPHEQTGKMPTTISPPKKQTPPSLPLKREESTDSLKNNRNIKKEKNSGVPDWLKKSFPRN